MRAVSIITPPASYGVTAADMQAFLNLEAGQDTALLEGFIAAAYQSAREYMRRSIMPETLELRLDDLPSAAPDALDRLGRGVHVVHVPSIIGGADSIDLPYGPVASVASLTTYAPDNAATVFSAASYRHDVRRVSLNDGHSWPSNLRRSDAVAIRYSSGEATPPAAILLAIKQHVAAMYECREGCEMPSACRAALGQFRRLDDMGFY